METTQDACMTEFVPPLVCGGEALVGTDQEKSKIQVGSVDNLCNLVRIMRTVKE